MAGKGTYGAYIQQPQTPSAMFAGESQLARMADRAFQRRKEERADQRRLVSDSNKAVSNAVEASNVDVSQINGKVHEAIYKVLDSYQDRLVDLKQKADRNPSPDNNFAIKKLQSEFQSSISALKGIGSSMTHLSQNRGEYDDELSSGVYNGNTDFVLNLPKIVDNLNPETLEVGGKKITALYNEMVDLDKLVKNVDSEGYVNDFVKTSLGEPEENSVFNAQTNTETTVTSYPTYDEAFARKQFISQVKGTDEFRKMALQLNKARANMVVQVESGEMDQEELDEFDVKYTSSDNDGVYISEDNMFDYVRDNQIEPLLTKQASKPRFRPQRNLTSQQIRGQEQLEENLKNANKVNALWSGDPSGIIGNNISVAGQSAQVVSGGFVYDPKTGVQSPSVEYMFISPTDGTREKAVRTRRSQLDPDPKKGKQQVGNMLWAGFDYQTITSDNNIQSPPIVKLNFESRQEGVDNWNKSENQLVADFFARGGSDEDAVKRNLIGSKESLVKEMPDLVASVMKDNISIPTKIGDVIKVGDQSYSLKNEDDVKEATRKLSLVSNYGRQLIELGESPATVKKELDALIKQETPQVELDPVRRYLATLPEGDTRENAWATAEELIAMNKSDKEILEELKSGSMASKMSKLSDKYDNLDGYITELQEKNPDYSREEILNQLYNKNFK